MGWLGDLWRRIESRETVDMVFMPVSDPDHAGSFENDECYVELYVDSLRLRNARRFATRFDGVVYTFVSLPREGEGATVVPAISKPDNLAKLDPHALARVIAVNKQMMGAVPWRGGPLLLELGLFSVKGGDLLTPVLNFITELSSAAGVSFVGKVAPFAPLISQGMSLLSGQTEDVAMEVGLDTAMSLTAPGTYAIVAASKDDRFDPQRVSLDPNDRKLLLDGRPLGEAYCVFSLRRTEQKSDYGEIPDLKERYAALTAAMRAGDQDRAKEALAAFRLSAIASPDLISKDARRLIEKAKAKVEEAFPVGPALAAGKPLAPPPPRLADLDLYGAE